MRSPGFLFFNPLGNEFPVMFWIRLFEYLSKTLRFLYVIFKIPGYSREHEDEIVFEEERMPDDGGWEIFRKRLQRLEQESDDLIVLVKELKQMRDALASAHSASIQKQKEAEEWLTNMQRISAETIDRVSRAIESLTKGGSDRIEGGFREGRQTQDASQEMLLQVLDKLIEVEKELHGPIQERFQQLEIQLQSLREKDSWILDQVLKATDSMGNAFDHLRQTAGFLEGSLKDLSRRVDIQADQVEEKVALLGEKLFPERRLLDSAIEKLGRLEIQWQNHQEQDAQVQKRVEELSAGYESVQKTLRMLEDFFDRIYQKLITLPPNQ